MPEINPEGRRDGETPDAFAARVKVEAKALAEAEAARIKAQSEARIAAVKAAAAEDLAKEKAGAALGARRDFVDQVKRWTGWAMGVMTALTIVAVVLSILPWTKALIAVGDAVKGFVIVGGLSVLRYILVRWGVIAGDVIAWVCLILSSGATVAWAWLTISGLWRGKLLAQAKALEQKGERYPAVAIEAAARGFGGNSQIARAFRKGRAAIMAASPDSTAGEHDDGGITSRRPAPTPAPPPKVGGV